MVFSVRMKKQNFSHLEKQEFCHIDGCFHGRLCVLVDLFDVFHGCQHQFMSVLWFLSVRMKKQEFSHFYGWLCVLVNLFDVFHGCQQQFMSVLWFLSVRMKKQRNNSPGIDPSH